MTDFRWTVSGESRRLHSSPPWRPESHEGRIAAESAGAALEAIITGRGATLTDSIPWDLIDQDRPITITIRPEQDGQADR